MEGGQPCADGWPVVRPLCCTEKVRGEQTQRASRSGSGVRHIVLVERSNRLRDIGTEGVIMMGLRRT